MGGMHRSHARYLRQNPTETERALWRPLRLRQLDGHKFRRQQPIGPYIVDFICLTTRLIIELDGGQHSTQTASDTKRSVWLETQGFRVLRLWNHEVFQNIEAVKEKIREALLSPHPNLPPHRGEGEKGQEH